MLLMICRWLTVIFIALSMGPAICHFLEMPAKINFEGALWVRLHHTLYREFGTVGAFFEVSAVLLSIWLTYLVRRIPRSFFWTFLGALGLVLSHAAFWLGIDPVNAVMISADPGHLPDNWEALRFQWEFTHAVRAGLETLALAAIVFSILVEIPVNVSNRPRF